MEDEKKFSFLAPSTPKRGNYGEDNKKGGRLKKIEVHIEVETLNLDVAKVDLEMMMVSFISNVI
jgi:hypothetical protein